MREEGRPRSKARLLDLLRPLDPKKEQEKSLLTGTLDSAARGEVELADLIVARDLAREAPTLLPGDNLRTAIEKMTASEVQELVVVDPADPRRPLAVLSHDGVMRAYDRTLFSARG